MTTARKPRSTTAARKTTATPETSSEKKTAATKTRSKPAKTAAKKSAPTPHTVHETALSGSAAGVTAARETATESASKHTTLEGGAAPAARAANPEIPHRVIAVAAYYRAEQRGFAPGGEVMDWLQAEAELRGTQRRR
jgi:hypothetical protein